MAQIDLLLTEAINPNTRNIDAVSTLEMVRLINEEDKKVALCVEKELPQIAKAIDLIYDKLRVGGRLIYCGAGTSGRLGVLDAVECRPTYGVPDTLVIGLMAGGNEAMFKAKEGAEDDFSLGQADLKAISFSAQDVLVGIAASGRTPYVLGAVAWAKSLGAVTIAVSCNPESELHRVASLTIAPQPGPEAVSGSTRMKAGTAQKMVLNMLSTGVMVRMGKVYGNLMVDVQATNEKLVRRAQNLVCEATGVQREEAETILAKCNNNVKVAIVCILCCCDSKKANALLEQVNGRIADVM